MHAQQNRALQWVHVMWLHPLNLLMGTEQEGQGLVLAFSHLEVSSSSRCEDSAGKTNSWWQHGHPTPMGRSNSCFALDANQYSIASAIFTKTTSKSTMQNKSSRADGDLFQSIILTKTKYSTTNKPLPRLAAIRVAACLRS
mmetsp:Transcript_32862/g.77577  ORF Transcript_32862/g.77577 Transcript_32862/m.77577 type:complete len:141 (-) Transcript_32862:724-1146(-)